MKRKLIVGITAAVMAALLATVLCACGGSGSSSSANYDSNFVGNWTVSSVTDNGQTVTTDQLTSYGITIPFTINSDHTATLDMSSVGGESYAFDWEAKDASTMSLWTDANTSEKVDATLDNGTLTITVDQESLTFTKSS